MLKGKKVSFQTLHNEGGDADDEVEVHLDGALEDVSLGPAHDGAPSPRRSHFEISTPPNNGHSTDHETGRDSPLSPADKTHSLGVGGLAWLGLAVLLASTNLSVLAWLMKQGHGRPAFSPAPLLAAGNLAGLIGMVPLFFKDLAKFRSVKCVEWMIMAVVAIFGPVLASFCLLRGLELSSVVTTAIIHRLDWVFLLVLLPVMVGRRLSCYDVLSGMITLLAVLVAAAAREPTEPMPVPRKGLAYLVAAAFFAALSRSLTARYLKTVPAGILVVVRMLVAYLLLHGVAAGEWGPHEGVRAIYDPRLWVMMLWYAPILIWGLELSWLRGLKASHSDAIASGMAFLPVLNLLWSKAIARQTPDVREVSGTMLVVLACILGLIGRWRGVQGVEDSEGWYEAVAKDAHGVHEEHKAEEGMAGDVGGRVTNVNAGERRFSGGQPTAPTREVLLRDRVV